MSGLALNPNSPDQAVIGNINGDTYVPSVTLYHGSYGIDVPVDPRAGGDRSFPVGLIYIVTLVAHFERRLDSLVFLWRCLRPAPFWRHRRFYRGMLQLVCRSFSSAIAHSNSAKYFVKAALKKLV